MRFPALHLALVRVRANARRLAGAALAIVLGTAFLAGAFALVAVHAEQGRARLAHEVGAADLVVETAFGSADPLPSDAAARAGAVPGVAAASDVLTTGLYASFGERGADLTLRALATAPGLEASVLVEGTLPAAADQIALSRSAADRLEVPVGAVVQATTYGERLDSPALRVTGIVEDFGGVFGTGTGALGTRPLFDRLAASVLTYHPAAVLVEIADGADREQVHAALREAFGPGTVDVSDAAGRVRATGQEPVAENVLSEVAGAAFAALALVVAALVVSATFGILVVQRTRELALLRCVGATGAQLRRAVLLEGLAMGLTASALGTALGWGLGQAYLATLRASHPLAGLGDAVRPTLVGVAVPLLVGTVLTVAATLGPARAATRVSPLAALQPPDATPERHPVRRGRLAAGVTLGLVGWLLLVLGVVYARTAHTGALGSGYLMATIGVLGALTSFLGFPLVAPALVPRLMAAAGGAGLRMLPARRRPALAMAIADMARNPRRTSAAVVTLTVGLTLVAGVATTAQSARASLQPAGDTSAEAELQVWAQGGHATAGGTGPGDLPALTEAQLAAVAGTPGVTAVAPVTALSVELGGTPDRWVGVTVLDPAAGAAVLRDATSMSALADGVLVMGPSEAEAVGQQLDTEVRHGQTLALGPARTPVRVALADAVPPGPLLTRATAEAAYGPLPTNAAWLRLDDGTSLHRKGAIVDDLRAGLAAASADGAIPELSGEVLGRIQEDALITTVLRASFALLAVAVAIAVVGVVSTLTLSVLERRREHALLRAVGLTRGQLRASLAAEGVLISVVGAVLGCVFGVAYVAAASAMTSDLVGGLTFSVPWGTLAAAVAGAVVAGLAASILPVRSALRATPVAALSA